MSILFLLKNMQIANSLYCRVMRLYNERYWKWIGEEIMIGQRLNSLRKSKKFSLQDMADRLGVAKSTYAGYESEYRQPPLETVKKAANIFDTTTDYLLGHTDEPSPPSEEDELDEIKKIISDNPRIGIFFKDLLEHPEESREEILEIWEVVKKRRAARDKQGE
jgi:transcriptional regulator with XRE-family HTH domain